MNNIIVIVGMCGSGKSEAVKILEEKGYTKVYFGNVTFNKMKELNITINKENEMQMQKRLREEYGMGAYALLSLPIINKEIKNNNIVIDGLYSWDELKVLKDNLKENLTIIALISDKDIRYNRLKIREVRPYTNIEAQKRDIFEIENTAKGGPIAYADYYIYNNGSLLELKNRLEDIIKK